MLNRRSFIKYAGAIGGGYLALRNTPLWAMPHGEDEMVITILHTNDVHSRIEAFPMDGSKNAGMGGAAARASLIESIRKENPNVLLLDAGDMWQGTPYFNFFDGEVEYKVMNQMKYDAATLGNHDFDIGIEGLAKQLPTAQFSILNANYDFSDTSLEGKIEPYKIFNKGEVKIGVFGIGIELKGLVSENNYGQIKYNDPIKVANDTAALLKKDLGCHLVICLSHLGFKYQSDKVSDEILATSTSNIDLILGGHTHTFFEKPEEYSNSEGKTVLVNQVGWAGIMLGRVDFHFKKMSLKKAEKFSALLVKK
jgi:5'-nucleotidase